MWPSLGQELQHWLHRPLRRSPAAGEGAFRPPSVTAAKPLITQSTFMLIRAGATVSKKGSSRAEPREAWRSTLSFLVTSSLLPLQSGTHVLPHFSHCRAAAPRRASTPRPGSFCSPFLFRSGPFHFPICSPARCMRCSAGDGRAGYPIILPSPCGSFSLPLNPRTPEPVDLFFPNQPIN